MAAWLCRGLGVVVASSLILSLVRAYDADPSTFLARFSAACWWCRCVGAPDTLHA